LAAVHFGAATDAARDAAWGPGEQVDPVALRDLVAAVADCAGTGWLQANTHDPDIGRVTALLDLADGPVPPFRTRRRRYRNRSLIERRYCPIKQWRGFANRYDEHATLYRRRRPLRRHRLDPAGQASP
jgi:hypothetical protein